MSLSFIDLSSVLGIFLGIALAASAGFRVFIPLFLVSLATHFGIGSELEISSTWKWLGDTPTLITLGIATILEIVAYYIPFVDNLLDTIAVPLAGIAGTLLMASQMVEFSPLLTWGLAIVAGGGTAAAIKTSTSTGRLASSTTTAGTGNFIISTAETITSSFLGVFAIFIPVIAFGLVLIILFLVYKFGKKFYSKFIFTPNNDIN